MSSSRIRSSSLTDYFVGARVRKRRTDLGLSAHQIGERINLSYQQVLNYERGVDRISAGRLYEIACALDTPITISSKGFTTRSRGHLPRGRASTDNSTWRATYMKSMTKSIWGQLASSPARSRVAKVQTRLR
jgi:transcriptional regulator with XRE-family HTH domain